MRHGQARELLPDYALGLLSPAESADLARHIEECPPCRDEAGPLVFAATGLAVIGALEPALLHVAAPFSGVPPDAASRVGAAVAAALEARHGQRLLSAGPDATASTDVVAPGHSPTGPVAVVRALSARRADAWYELAGGAPAYVPPLDRERPQPGAQAPGLTPPDEWRPGTPIEDESEGPDIRVRRGDGTGRAAPDFFDAADAAIPSPGGPGRPPELPRLGRLFRRGGSRRAARDESVNDAAAPRPATETSPAEAAEVDGDKSRPAAAEPGEPATAAEAPPAPGGEEKDAAAHRDLGSAPPAESRETQGAAPDRPGTAPATADASGAAPSAVAPGPDEQGADVPGAPEPAPGLPVAASAVDTGRVDEQASAPAGPAGVPAAQSAVGPGRDAGPIVAAPRRAGFFRARLHRGQAGAPADEDYEDEWAVLARFDGPPALPPPAPAGGAARRRPETLAERLRRGQRAPSSAGGPATGEAQRPADAFAAATWVPGPEEHRPRRGLFGRRTPQPVAGPGPAMARPGEMDAAISELAVQPPRGLARPGTHNFKEPATRGRKRVPRIDDDEDPRALVSFDEEIRRLSRPLPALPMRAGFAPGYVPAPVEWGLDRYDHDEDDEDQSLSTMVVSSDLVSSNWRFWTIMLAVFSAVLFGIMVYGYLYLRDLRSEQQQLEVASEASAVPLRFVLVENPDERFNPRGSGYFEKSTGVALLYFTGLPLIDRSERFQLWSEGPFGTKAIGAASPFGGSTQTVEARNVPSDTTRIFMTIESPVGDSYPTQPQGLVLLEVEVP